jgi:hypothetical protein
MLCLNEAVIFLSEPVLDIFETKQGKKNIVLCKTGAVQNFLASEGFKL